MLATSDAITISGPIVRGDDVQLSTLLAANPSVKAIILYDSPGGDGLTMQRISGIIRGDLLATGVAGYCNSACAMIFLSGVQRYFTDMVPLDETSLGFHGSYTDSGTLTPERRLRMIAGMIATETAGKADPALVQRWTHLPENRTMRFTYPALNRSSSQATVFDCPVPRRNLADYGACTPVPGYDAFTMGIITSTTILHVTQ